MLIRTRRDFLMASALTVGSFVISTGLTGCNDHDTTDTDVAVAFSHGVASGDPQNDRVILWTRVTPLETVDSFSVTYEVATDEAFASLVRPAEQATVSKDGDYTLKIDFRDLEAGTTYFYRFRVGNTLSPIGKTKTLPTTATRLKMAVFTCANYPKGYFNAYTEAAKIGDLDVTVHLGDYIYEYGMFEADGVTPAYATENAVNIGRELPADNDTELLTLDDYRKRYALYHTDTGLQTIHAAAPMIPVWDDHEVADDAYVSGALNHNDDEGSYDERKAAALQAYFEWVPIRPVTEDDHERIYRSFDFGDLVSLHMLDTRLIGRVEQLSYADFPELLSGDTSNFIAALSSPEQTMLGTEQLQWLQNTMTNSTAVWQVLGQQVLMGRMWIPAELLVLIGQLQDADILTQIELLNQFNALLPELYAIKSRLLAGDPTLTPEETARVTTTLPYNLDAWDGYFAEREVILQTALQLDKNLVVLAGDTHNGWANDLKALDTRQQPTLQVGVEFATPAVTSPGMEEYASLQEDKDVLNFEAVMTLLVDDLHYFNANNRGFMTVTFTEDEAVAEWTYVDTIDTTTYGILETRTKQLKTTTTTRNIETA